MGMPLHAKVFGPPEAEIEECMGSRSAGYKSSANQIPCWSIWMKFW